MSLSEVVFIGVPVVCFSVTMGLFIGALCATAKQADAHLEIFEQDQLIIELQRACDQYVESRN
jgi:hypothetical protein